MAVEFVPAPVAAIRRTLWPAGVAFPGLSHSLQPQAHSLIGPQAYSLPSGYFSAASSFSSHSLRISHVSPIDQSADIVM